MWVREVAFANLTSSGTVSTPSGPEPAFALQNSSVQVQGNFSQVVHEVIPPAAHSPSGAVRTFNSALYVSSAGSATLTFAPALGLLPENLSVGSWNSTATYHANGAWSMNYSFSKTSFAGVTKTVTGTNPGRVTSAVGTLTVRGSTLGGLELNGGAASTATRLQVGGPFILWDGLILVPAGSELLQPPVGATGTSAAMPWSSDEAGWETAATSAVDVGRASSIAHLPVLASSTAYDPSSSDSGTAAINYTTAALTPDDGPGTLVMQGEPINVASVPTQNCIVQACSSSSPSSSPSPLRGVLLLGIALVAVVVVAVAVVAGRQPPRRPAPSPNARNYPPVGAPATPPAPASPAPPGDPEPDPLGNLW
jgi:hypothetical protein